MLNYARFRASACSLGDKVYVFGGCDLSSDGVDYHNSVECLDYQAYSTASYNIEWSLIEPSESDVVPRCISLFVPIGPSEVMIMGGYNQKAGGPLSDSLVFDTRQETFRPLPGWDTNDNDNKITCLGNLSHTVGRGGKVLAFVVRQGVDY